MDERKKDEKNICCTLCGKSDKLPEYEPEIHRFRNDQGDAEITSYKVFPGIELKVYSVHMGSFFFGKEGKGDFMEIHHCREGRMEQEVADGSAYIMPEDLSVTVRKQLFCRYSFPLSHYHGISVCIDINAAPECLSCFLDDVNVRPRELAKRLCGKGSCFIIRSQDYIGHIFSELYSVPESYKKGYYKVKILELLLVLGSIEPGGNSASAISLSKMQSDLAKKAAVYLSENLDRQITVAELSDRFHVSQTHLQNAFKGVYGVPVSSYIRVLKMQSAALQLIHTDTAVLDIAAKFGYSNAGKFASAFQRIMGETPGEYRKMHGSSGWQ
ncbi:helix-turn-helix transcriptional regulator [Parablautia muri]|nr:AraC family transcriptional regulator [Parablautia muri]